MVNPFKEVNWKPTAQDLRKFGVTLIIGFPIVAVLMLVLRRMFSGAWHWEAALSIAAIGVGAGVLFWLIPAIARPFYFVWFFVACCIGIVVSNVLLGLFFFTIVTGTGILMRVLGKLSFRKYPDKSLPTYWLDAERITDPKRYYHQF